VPQVRAIRARHYSPEEANRSDPTIVLVGVFVFFNGVSHLFEWDLASWRHASLGGTDEGVRPLHKSRYSAL